MSDLVINYVRWRRDGILFLVLCAKEKSLHPLLLLLRT